jgi:hypothetical protein
VTDYDRSASRMMGDHRTTYVVYSGQAEGIVMVGDEGEGEKGLDVKMVGDCELYFHGEDGPVGRGRGREREGR